ncbi:hypothetical protein [Mucilaginibacter sp. UR6-11]|uniref:hypothetical protein n=1 Tax=Mucilaginibacter sp. UR6-11 TaxID=1435644 RepID=UPI001E32469C|nr:hypothetical protein [Mucilaginibacter sp. UR6-11]MCC8426544.1 hypothetical protein [Mucilaginibacter sp. UR6-11]
MLKKAYLILFISAIANTAALAQQSLDVNFNGFGFLDNREYKAFVPRSRTYSGTRTMLDFGLNLDSLNHFIVGANALHEFGAQPFFGRVDPVAYYKYTGTKWNFYAGEFPRQGLLDNYPRALLNDTLRYYRPNVEGLLARYQTENFTETGWIDWVSRQTATRREQFLFGFSGIYKPNAYGPFYLSHYFFLMHDAGAEISVPNDHINDNGAGEIKLGLDFSHKTVLDSLTFEAGGLFSLERERGVDGFKTPAGFVFTAFASYHKFALYEEFYHGQGSTVVYGDSYYSKPTYNRIDIIYTPFLFDRIKGQFVASFHFSPGNLNDNQEVFRISYDLGRKVLKRFSQD